MELIFIRFCSVSLTLTGKVQTYAERRGYTLKHYQIDAEAVTQPWQDRAIGKLIKDYFGKSKQFVIYDIAEQVCNMEQAFTLIQALKEACVTLHVVKQNFVLSPQNYNEHLLESLRQIERVLRKSYKSDDMPIKKHGRPRGGKALRKLDKHKKAVVYDLQVTRLSRSEVADKYEVSRSTLDSWLLHNHIYIRTSRKLDRHIEVIKRYLREEKSHTEIARILKVDPSTISRFIKAEGLDE